MVQLKLLADDLTGALDTSAEFVGAFGPIDVVWSADEALNRRENLAIDTGTRECTAMQAAAVVQGLAPWLADASIAFKKVDSLLRGPWAAELDACLRSGRWDACIVAPAFAYQGRRTVGGQQQALAPDGHWQAVGDSIFDQLRAQGIDARPGEVGAELPRGVTVFDAASEDDMVRIVQTGRRSPHRVLWCGSGGLAAALADKPASALPRALKRPVLGVFGSDHAATEAQLAACPEIVVRAAGGHVDVDAVRQQLSQGVALVRLDAPRGHSREQAARHFAQEITALSRGLDPPGTLIAAGGETLKAQCLAVAASALTVFGRLEPGVPRSVIQGGGWAGVDVISKSGAFGSPDLWRKLLGENQLIREET